MNSKADEYNNQYWSYFVDQTDVDPFCLFHGPDIEWALIFNNYFYVLLALHFITYSELALDHPELFKQRASLQAFDVLNALANDGKVTQSWEERKSKHAWKTREKHLQWADAASFLCKFVIRHSVGQTLSRLNIKCDPQLKYTCWIRAFGAVCCEVVHSPLHWAHLHHCSVFVSHCVSSFFCAAELNTECC